MHAERANPVKMRQFYTMVAASVLSLLSIAGWEGRTWGAPAGQPSAGATPDGADARADQAWLYFRQAFPFHMQTLAVTEAEADGSRTLIVSEPPPHVDAPGLAAVDRTALARPQIKQWTLGYDGWVKDVVYTLPKLTQRQLDELIGKLSAYLYATDYKHYALRLPIDRRALRTKYPLDIRVHTGDLEGWYKGRSFRPVEGGESLRLQAATPGVYLSEPPGLVAWVLPKEGFDRRKADVRKFALDSDLILGAVARDDSVVIFGRERIVPVAVLPPIRAEVVVNLAATDSPSLSQSYERTLFGAGASANRWDWAPIYLSPELLDTEYGSILNFTDQMLKGWSQAGTTEYHNFPCDPPSRYPFDAPLSRVLKSSTLLFNWNTLGFGMESRGEGLSLYAATRTGALPVIYRPEPADGVPPGRVPGAASKADEATKRAEEQAYGYYAALNHPMLARAVQYAMLYQVFLNYKVAPEQTPDWPRWNQSHAMAQLAAQVLKALRQADDEALKRWTSAVLSDLRERSRAARRPLPQGIDENVATTLRSLKALYQGFYDKHKDAGEAWLAARLGATRDFDEARPNRPEDEKLDNAATFMAAMLSGTQGLTWICDLRTLEAGFSRSRGESSNLWLHTPTAVYSRSLGMMALAVGGHDLDSELGRVVRDATLERGKIRVDNDRTITANPEDAVVIEREARRIARTGNVETLKSDLEAWLRDRPELAARPEDEVLAANAANRTSRGMGDRLLQPGPGPGGSGLPPPLPPAPGSAPSAEPPRDDGLFRSFPARSAQVVLVSKVGGMATIRRQARAGSETVEGPSDYWHLKDLTYALREELLPEGRESGKEPLRIAFDETYTTEEARRVMDNLVLHAKGDPDGPLRVVYRLDRAAARTFHEPVERATVVEGSLTAERSLSRDRVDGTEVRAQIGAATASGRSEISLKIFLAGVHPERGAVEKSMADSVDGANASRVTLGDLPPTVFQDLVRDMQALRGKSSAVARYRGADIYITQFEHRGLLLGALGFVTP
jgi:hypothetical protein